MKRILGKETRSRQGILLEGLPYNRRKRKRKMLDTPGDNVHNDEMAIEELCAEIDRLRRLNAAQNAQLIQMQNRIADNSNEASNQLVRTLIDGLRGLTIDTKIPRFCEPENPNNFIERLEKYFMIKNLQGNRLNVVDECFDGRARHVNF